MVTPLFAPVGGWSWRVRNTIGQSEEPTKDPARWRWTRLCCGVTVGVGASRVPQPTARSLQSPDHQETLSDSISSHRQ
jgi:hypothetical protein